MKVSKIVSCDWLYENLSNKNCIILDARSAYSLHTLGIKGAIYFDLAGSFSDNNNPLPNSFPSEIQFQKEARILGINTSSHLIIYDEKGIFNSPRVWWMFKVMGHEKVSVLDGGLPEWLKKDFPTSILSTKRQILGNFTAKMDASKIKDFSFIQRNSIENSCLVIDARSKGRFDGTEPEPRAGISSGSIPNSINIPYTEVLNGTKFKPLGELKEIFKSIQTKDKPTIFSCGSGVTACIVLLAFEMVKNTKTAIYDGSWTEWAIKNQKTT